MLTIKTYRLIIAVFSPFARYRFTYCRSMVEQGETF